MYSIDLDIHKKNAQACVMDENGKVAVNERSSSNIISALLQNSA